MPPMLTTAPRIRPRASTPLEALPTSVESREGRRQEVVEPAGRLRDRDDPADDGQQREHAHRGAHRQRALGDRVLGAGEADVGVLDLAVGGVGRLLGVEEVAVLDQLARLRARLAEEGAEDHPERVERGQQRADVAGGVQRPVPAAAAGDEEQDRVLGEEAAEGRDAGEREAADDEADEGERSARRRPDMRSSDWLPPIALITEPAAMNSSALKKAWVIRWKRPAV